MNEVYFDLTYWMLQFKFWMAVGLVLVCIDIFLGSFFILPIGLASFFVGILIYAQHKLWFGDFVFIEDWRDVALLFSILAVLSVGFVKLVFQKMFKKGPDINQY